MRISDWSSDVCSSDLIPGLRFDSYRSSSDLADSNSDQAVSPRIALSYMPSDWFMVFSSYGQAFRAPHMDELYLTGTHFEIPVGAGVVNRFVSNPDLRSEEHTSELQSLMRISYAVFCLKKK